MDQTEIVADVGVHRSRSANFASRLVSIFRVSTIKLALALVREVAAELCGNIPDSELRITFVKSGNLIEGYIIAIRHVDLETEYTRDTV